MGRGTDEDAVRNLIGRFANSFDLKAWDELAACLTETIYTDYSDFRGTAPERVTRERYVAERREGLRALKTHHLTGNVEVALDGGRGTARVSMVIYRSQPGGEVLNTHCWYTLEVEAEAVVWRISSIVQKVLWSDGNAAIHAGAKTT